MTGVLTLSRARCGAAVLVALAVFLGADRALAKKPRRKANLAVTAAELKGNPYGFWEEKGTITVEDITKNTGARRAGPSITRVYLVHGGHHYRLADRPVPALRPGKEHRDESSSDPFATHDYPIGAYRLMICADAKHQVNESSEHNCKWMQPRHFFVIPRAWTGSLGGVETRSITDRWSSPDAQFTFDQYEGGGIVSYVFSGAVTWTNSGTDAEGCTISGSGTRNYSDDASIGALSVDYLNGTYSGGLQDTSGPPFQVAFSNCRFPPPPQPGVYEPAFWLPSVSGNVSLAFGSTSLPGSPFQMAGATYNWNLRAGFAP
jgi:hypothetical protein